MRRLAHKRVKYILPILPQSVYLDTLFMLLVCFYSVRYIKALYIGLYFPRDSKIEQGQLASVNRANLVFHFHCEYGSDKSYTDFEANIICSHLSYVLQNLDRKLEFQMAAYFFLTTTLLAY